MSYTVGEFGKLHPTPVYGWSVDALDFLPALVDVTGQLKVSGGGAGGGDASAANQTTQIARADTANASLASIDGKTPALGQALAASSVPVILPSATITTLTPPAAITGFATSARQDTGNTALTSIDGKLTSLGQKTSASSTPVVLASDALPPPDRAATGTIIANAASVSVGSAGTGTVSLVLTGTWTGLLLFFGVDASGASQLIKAFNMTSEALETTTSANGIWLLPSGGWSSVGVLSFSWSSGTASVALIASPGSHVVALGRSLPTGTNSIGQVTANAGTNLSTAALALEAGNLATIASAIKAEDAAAADADKGIALLSTRTDSPIGLTTANGDYQWLTTDAQGRLWINADTLNARFDLLVEYSKQSIREQRLQTELLLQGMNLSIDPEHYRRDNDFAQMN
jgi:hypothetical protein